MSPHKQPLLHLMREEKDTSDEKLGGEYEKTGSPAKVGTSGKEACLMKTTTLSAGIRRTVIAKKTVGLR